MWPFKEKKASRDGVKKAERNQANPGGHAENSISIDEVTVIINELIQIGIDDTYYWDGERKNTAKYDEHGNNRKAIEIGNKLRDLRLMEFAHSEVLKKCGSVSARSLELVWE
jgi:hypothetical protein